jgi:uncharacterized protein with FMN-binding domain
METVTRRWTYVLLIAAQLSLICGARGEDAKPGTAAVIELLTGTKVEGRITARDEQKITVEVRVGGRVFPRAFPIDRIRAVTIAGRREVLNGPADAGGAPSEGTTPGAAARVGVERSRMEIDRLIDQLGRTPPDWWESVKLNYPRTLDLSWPQRPPPPWNARKNVGQYLWEIIQPNPGKWNEGVRFVHHLVEMHAGSPEKRERAMTTLGRLYYLLQQDYARAAFWWRQAGVDRSSQSPQAVNLAECYWRLGNKQMALDLLDNTSPYFSSIKLLADMGETERALQIAEAGARSAWPDLAWLYAGDACRIDGQYERAIGYYEKVLDVRPVGRAAERIQRNHQRARANVEGIRIFDTLDLRRVPDGAYRAASAGYAGDVHVEVVVRGGRIAAVQVTSHKEKQYFTALMETPRKIIEKQGLKGVDATTSATVTSEAIINATAKALAKGLK